MPSSRAAYSAGRAVEERGVFCGPRREVAAVVRDAFDGVAAVLPGPVRDGQLVAVRVFARDVSAGVIAQLRTDGRAERCACLHGVIHRALGPRVCERRVGGGAGDVDGDAGGGEGLGGSIRTRRGRVCCRISRFCLTGHAGSAVCWQVERREAFAAQVGGHFAILHHGVEARREGMQLPRRRLGVRRPRARAGRRGRQARRRAR